MGEYVNIRGLRVIPMDGLTYREISADLTRRLEYYADLRPYSRGCIARRDDKGQIVLTPAKVEPQGLNMELDHGKCWL